MPGQRAARTEIGLLDCLPRIVVNNDVLDTGQDPEQLVRDAAPGVVRVETEPPLLWWGYDKDDRVVAAVALGDIEPAPYSIFVCGNVKRAVRTFNVDGVEVVVVTETVVLPDEAEIVEFTGTLIDSGSGPAVST